MHSSQFTPLWESTSVACNCYLALIYSLLIRTQWFSFVGADTGPLRLPGSFTHRHCPVTHCYPPGHGVRRAYSLLHEEKENASPNLVSSPKEILLFLVLSFLVLHGEGAGASGRFVSCACGPLHLCLGSSCAFMPTPAVAVTIYIKEPGPAEPCSLFMCVLLGVAFPFSSSALLVSCSFNFTVCRSLDKEAVF